MKGDVVTARAFDEEMRLATLQRAQRYKSEMESKEGKGLMRGDVVTARAFDEEMRLATLQRAQRYKSEMGSEKKSD